MVTLRHTLSLMTAAVCCSLPGIAWGDSLLAGGSVDEKAASSQAVSLESDHGDLGRYCDLLESDSFSQRRLASQELTAAGTRALPALEKAIVAGSREATARAMAIVQQQFISGDDATRREAESLLERIADGENEFAARRAEEVLRPTSNATDRFMPLFGQAPVQRVRMVPQGVAQVRVAAPVQVRQFNVRNANGAKQITVVVNSRKIKISEDKDSIEVVVTETKDGKEVTEKFAAKDADELKKKHPEAHKIYQQHNGDGAIKFGVQIQVQGGN